MYSAPDGVVRSSVEDLQARIAALNGAFQNESIGNAIVSTIETFSPRFPGVQSREIVEK